MGKGAYPTASNNSNVREEIDGDPNRLVPSSDWFVLAIDGQTWLRSLGIREEDFYHGVGYWIQGRAEFALNQFLTINSRTVLYSGSSSEGYANPSGIYNLIGFTGVWPTPVLNSELSVRVGDLERRTIGAGLLSQDREVNGGFFRLSNHAYTFSILGDSTGGLVYGDDTVNPQIAFFDEAFGLGAVFWTASEEQSSLLKKRDPYYYLISKKNVFSRQIWILL